MLAALFPLPCCTDGNNKHCDQHIRLRPCARRPSTSATPPSRATSTLTSIASATPPCAPVSRTIASPRWCRRRGRPGKDSPRYICKLALPVSRQAEPGEGVRAGDGGMARCHVRHGLGGHLAARTSLKRQAKSFLGRKNLIVFGGALVFC
jgi:hypothetical protein